MSNRVKLVILIFVIFWIVLLSRLYYLSIKSNTYYQELAKRNIINTEYLAPNRGEIRDSNGSIIAMNKLGFSIYLKPYLSTKSKEGELLKDLEFITSIFQDFNKSRLLSKYKKRDTPYNHKPIQIIDFIPYKDMIEKFVVFSQHENISIKPASKRFYPYKDLAAHVIGYVSKANQKEIEDNQVAKYLGIVGKSGIEKQYDTLLGGTMGKREIKVTAANKEIKLLNSKEPTSSNMTLTIDLRLQKYLKEIFEDRNGAIIVMNVQNGAIIAAGSYPEYDINTFVEGISTKEWQKMITDLDHPFTNKFIAGLYPPGSATKPAVALSFLNSDLIDENEKFFCTGELRLGKRKFRCWSSHGHGEVDIRRSISESCDDYFYKAGLRVGIDKISTDLMRYGFGKKTGIDLPNEFIGTVPNRNWKINKYGESWYKGETLNTVIGQGDFLATPMQVTLFTAMIATTKQVTPHFVQKIDGREVTYESTDIFNFYEKSRLKIIQEGMYDVCNHKKGTAYKYNSSKIIIAGKTGTSQVIGIPQEEKKRMSEDDLKYYQKSHSWFTAYGPFKEPKYAVTILVEHGGHGGKATGELVSKIFNKLVDLGKIEEKFILQKYKTKEVNQTKP